MRPSWRPGTTSGARICKSKAWKPSQSFISQVWRRVPSIAKKKSSELCRCQLLPLCGKGPRQAHQSNVEIEWFIRNLFGSKMTWPSTGWSISSDSGPVVGACIEDPARLRLEIKHHMGLARLERRHWGLGYICIGGYTTQLCGDYSKPM